MGDIAPLSAASEPVAFEQADPVDLVEQLLTAVDLGDLESDETGAAIETPRHGPGLERAWHRPSG